jgi:hypothetical protein
MARSELVSQAKRLAAAERKGYTRLRGYAAVEALGITQRHERASLFTTMGSGNLK